MPGAMTNALNALSLISLTAPQSGHYYPHLPDERKAREKGNGWLKVMQLEVET